MGGALESSLAVALANPAAALRELDRIEYEDSLLSFLQAGWQNITPAPFVPGWHLEAVAEHLEAVNSGQINRLLINIPPRMTKSLLVSVAWPAWTWAQRGTGSPLAGPTTQFLCTSYGQRLTEDHSTHCLQLIQSEWYQEHWGERFDLTRETAQRFDNDKGGYRISTSVGGGLTGFGGDIIIVDDPHNTVEIESEAEIEKAVRWWDEALSTRLNNPTTGAFVVIMQRLSERDLSGHILDQMAGNWSHLMIPMEYEPRRHCVTTLPWEDPRTIEGQLIAPERFPPAQLASLKIQLGPYGTAGQLQQAPAPRGGGIIKAEWWQNYSTKEREVFLPDGRPARPLGYPDMEFILASVDTAMTMKEENDYSAFTVWGIWRNNFDLPQIMLMEAWSERLQFHELVDRCITVCRKRQVNRILIEGKNNGFSVVQEIQRLCRDEGFQTIAEPVKGDKVSRAHSVVPMFTAGMIWAPERKWADKVIDQCAAFPKGKHDDLVDSTTQALRHLRRTGLVLMPAEAKIENDTRMLIDNARKPEPVYDV